MDTTIEAGDFIEIPAWRVWGCVFTVEPSRSGLGSERAIDVLLQTYPEQPAEAMRRYRLEPHEYAVID